MITIIVGETYSTKELSEALHVTYNIFRKKKDLYLASLAKAYIYEVEHKGRGHGAFYHIIDQIGDYTSPNPRREQVCREVQQFIRETIAEDPMQTAANINRKAWQDNDIAPTRIALLGLKDSTTYEYIRVEMKTMYGTEIGEGGTDGMIQRKVWCRLDRAEKCYVEMPPEQVDEFMACFERVRKGQKETDIAIFGDYKSGLITRQQMCERLAAKTEKIFERGREMFHSRYGFYPIRVPVYLPKDWMDSAPWRREQKEVDGED